MWKCSCSPVALRNVMHGTRNFSAPFPHFLLFSLLPCIQDLYVVSGCITQGPTRSLHLEVGTEVYQVHRVFCRKYRDAQAPGETEDQLTVMGTKWGSCLAQVSLFWSPTALPVLCVFIFLAKGCWFRDGSLPKPGQSEFLPRTFNRDSRNSVFSGVKSYGMQCLEGTWSATRENGEMQQEEMTDEKESCVQKKVLVLVVPEVQMFPCFFWDFIYKSFFNDVRNPCIPEIFHFFLN